MLLERAIALDATSIEALEALESLTTETGDFQRLADVLERKLGWRRAVPSNSKISWDAWCSSTAGRSPAPIASASCANGWR